MIKRVRATEIRRRMESGSKDPILVRCSSPTGAVDVVAKLRGALPRDTFGLAIEYAVASLGKDLGLDCGEIMAVEFDEAMVHAAEIAGETKLARLIERSLGLNVGSAFLGPGFSATTCAALEKRHFREQLSGIFAFDFLIQNFDRVASNPNLLRKGKRLVLIDHEQALGNLDVEGEVHFALDMLKIDPFFRHLAFICVADLAPTFAGLFERLAALPKSKIHGYIDDIPSAWMSSRLSKLREYLMWLRENSFKIKDLLIRNIVLGHED
jgi:hypothetical protein